MTQALSFFPATALLLGHVATAAHADMPKLRQQTSKSMNLKCGK